MKRETAMLCALAVTGALTAVVAGDFSDNFDSYAENSEIAGQGGWAPWDGNPDAGHGVVRADPHLSAPHSLEIDLPDDIVQEFPDGTYTSGIWRFSGWAYFPSGVTGTQYWILLNEYAIGVHDWTLDLSMDGTAGVVSTTEHGGELPLVRDDWAQIEVYIDLDNNFQWIAYDGEYLASGVWADTGLVEIQCLDLYNDSGSSAIYWDDIVLEEVPGPPTGACCFLDGTCQQMTPEDCDAAGGDFQEYFLSCAFANCPLPPENDDCVDAEALNDINGKGWDTRLATPDGPGDCNFGAPNIWYCWTPSENGLATFEIFDTDFVDPDATASMTIYSIGGTCVCPDDFNQWIYCQNDGNDPFAQIMVNANDTFLIEVGSDDSSAGGGIGKLAVYVGDPPPPVGACCVAGVCVDNTDQTDCEAQDGFWYAAQECPFLECPCAIAPPSEADVFEAEACGDDTNGGCNSSPAVFEDIDCGVTVQGIATLVDDGMGNLVRDTDWYRVTVAEPTTLTLTCEAQFDVTFGLSQYMHGSEGSGNCADTTGFISPAIADANDCEVHVLSDVALPIAGEYFIFVAPDFSNPDEFDCTVQLRYNLTVDCAVGPIPGACCVDGDCVQTGSLADCNAQGGDWFLGRDCADFNCPIGSCPPSDFNLSQNSDDGIVNGVACGGGGIGADNGWARSFTPDEVPDPFFVECVEFGVTSISGTDDWEVTLNVYEDTDGGEPVLPGVDLNLLGSETFLIVQGTANETVAVVLDTPVQIPEDATLVVEVWSDEMDPIGGQLFPGCNESGSETAPTYYRSVACSSGGDGRFVTYDSIGFGQYKLVLHVNGTDVGPECPEDLDSNGVVNVFDLLELLGDWGPCPGCPADLDGNDVVNVFDLLQLLGAWGPC